MDKRKTLIIKVAAAVIFIAFFSILLYFANQGNPVNYKTGANSPIKYVKAKVIEVLEDNTQVDENSEGLKRGHQLLEIKILSGEHKGETQIIDNYLGLLYNVYAKEGTRIIARIDTHDGEFSASIYKYSGTVDFKRSSGTSPNHINRCSNHHSMPDITGWNQSQDILCYNRYNIGCFGGRNTCLHSR